MEKAFSECSLCGKTAEEIDRHISEGKYNLCSAFQKTGLPISSTSNATLEPEGTFSNSQEVRMHHYIHFHHTRMDLAFIQSQLHNKSELKTLLDNAHSSTSATAPTAVIKSEFDNSEIEFKSAQIASAWDTRKKSIYAE